MTVTNTDRAWVSLGEKNPYWAVVTADQFDKPELSDRDKQEFFETGEGVVAQVFQLIRRHLDPEFAPVSALDFGCGVGRLLIPLARRCGYVIGLDVSDAMLAEAETNCAALGAFNAQFARSDDALSAVEGPFDLVHSFIVLQHLPPARGEGILEKLIQKLRVGGVAALHLTFATTPRSGRRFPALGIRRSLRDQWDRWFARGHGEKVESHMEMYAYDLNRIFRILHEQGVRRYWVEYTNHDDALGAMLLFQRERRPSYHL